MTITVGEAAVKMAQISLTTLLISTWLITSTMDATLRLICLTRTTISYLKILSKKIGVKVH